MATLPNTYLTGPNRDVANCTQLVVQIQTGQYPEEMAWGIVEAFPEVRYPVGSYTIPNTLYPGPGPGPTPLMNRSAGPLLAQGASCRAPTPCRGGALSAAYGGGP